MIIPRLKTFSQLEQREFGVHKAANKAAKKAWEEGIVKKISKELRSNQEPKSLLKQFRKFNNGRIEGRTVHDRINKLAEHTGSSRDWELLKGDSTKRIKNKFYYHSPLSPDSTYHLNEVKSILSQR